MELHPAPFQLGVSPLSAAPDSYTLSPPPSPHASITPLLQAGDLLYGSITFNPANQSYTIYHNVSGSTTWEVSTNIKVQKKNKEFKNYTIAYFVYEKVAPCGDYPPDGIVTFTNIRMECDNKQVTPNWSTAYVEDVCNNRASIVDPATIKITWDTKAEDPSPELIAASQATKSLGPARKQ